ncbi:MAG: Gfo/Idh/MocA family oxidoreductase [Lachnospiraceae bacterium]|nr:Gfo/Idh/MocA family oxidoreductase [Lachnospiraceae bacterium]
MRLGIIGTGRIAGRMVKETAYADGITLCAVYNPHAGSASRFVNEICAKDHRFAQEPLRAFEDAEAFLETVDAVYIASPHETHFSYVTDALRHGKHVLCEKPLCLSGKEAGEAYALASEKGLVLFEAIKTAYCPGFSQLLEAAKSGVIGEIRNIEACFTKLEKTDSRELTDLTYGGSFTELGSYVLLPAIKLFGTDYEDLRFDSIRGENGLDLFTRASLTYPQGMATLTCGLRVKSEGRLLICGTKGYLLVEAPWWKTNHFEAHFEDASRVQKYTNEFLGDGLRYELLDFLEVVRKSSKDHNHTERPAAKLTASESIAMASIMETFLSQGT